MDYRRTPPPPSSGAPTLHDQILLFCLKWKNWEEGEVEELIAVCSRNGYGHAEILGALKAHYHDPTPAPVDSNGRPTGVTPSRHRPKYAHLRQHLEGSLRDRRRREQDRRNRTYSDLSLVSTRGAEHFTAIRAELARVKGATRHMGTAGGAVL